MVASSVHRLTAGSTRTTVARAAALISTNTKGSARPLWPCPLPFLVWPMVCPHGCDLGYVICCGAVSGTKGHYVVTRMPLAFP